VGEELWVFVAAELREERNPQSGEFQQHIWGNRGGGKKSDSVGEGTLRGEDLGGDGEASKASALIAGPGERRGGSC